LKHIEDIEYFLQGEKKPVPLLMKIEFLLCVQLFFSFTSYLIMHGEIFILKERRTLHLTYKNKNVIKLYFKAVVSDIGHMISMHINAGVFTYACYAVCYDKYKYTIWN
jgi:hypothetical protein